jgi:Spy/CpxP family protein refolding chaperone
MKRLYLTIATLTAVALTAPVVHAQGQDNSPPPPQQHRMAMRGGPGGPGMMMFKDITLSAAQKDSVKAIGERYRKQMMDIRKNSNGDRQAAMSQMTDLMKKQQADYRAILTADQQKTFDKNVQDMQQRRKEMMEHHRGGGSGGRN